MTARNDITGDLIRSIGGADLIKDDSPDPVFHIYHCDHCHIKVATCDGLCPCCGKNLKITQQCTERQ